MNFQERLESIKQRIEGNMPASYLKIMHGATRALEQSGIQKKVLKVGATMPTFALLNQARKEVNSQELLQAPLVITFYRGVWCPYCNADLANLKKYVPEIEALGARLIAISPEQPEYLKKIIGMQKLNFDILHDAGNTLAAQFGLKFQLPQDLKELYRDKFNVNLKLHQGNDEWALPMPARFVVDTQGVIQYAESAPDYRQRPNPDDLMEVLKVLAVS